MVPIINYLAVLVAAIVGMVAGFLWYSPVLFGNAWMKEMNLDQKKLKQAKKNGMGKTYVLSFIILLVTSYVLAHFVDYADASTFGAGMLAGFWIWLGFYATTMMGSVLWEKKSWNLYLMNVSHYLVVLLLMGGILAIWS